MTVAARAPVDVRWVDGADAAAAAASTPTPAVVGVAGQADRAAARLAIRAALRGALAAACGVDPARVRLEEAPGRAPRARVDDGTPGGRAAWLAISHDGALSLAAWRFDGPVGIDVMQVQPVPDWEAVARDYLGPAAAASLASLAADARPAAFAHAWSLHEARLKCLGRQLEEWQAAVAPALERCACLPLALPEGYVGYVGYLALG